MDVKRTRQRAAGLPKEAAAKRRPGTRAPVQKLSGSRVRRLVPARGKRSGAGLSRPEGTGCTQGRARQSSGRNRTLAQRDGKLSGLDKGPNDREGQNELARGLSLRT